ncbi:pole-organizing protein PopZ [Stakelama sediminis]|uniref:DUF2497 domain-containing protein n=1 Tax=Stakelama sediminis TaxID=463200 RepID=A0A840YXZ1_9SPHN|nr:DUF2497 domain-containing protein [Stakelama sediminis]MBB5718631.1 hypothetical protein [Stakelama sediminis]
MGDISNETSMEDILSSIKRIIAEEGGSVRKSRGRAAPAVQDAVDDDEGGPVDARDPADAVLELREAVEEAVANQDRLPRHAISAPPVEDYPPVAEEEPDQPVEVHEEVHREEPAKPASPETILSQRTAEASRGSLEALSRLIVRPETPGSDTLEGLVREMLRPMLREWLDTNLPAMVEKMVAREIARITAREGGC